MKLKSKKGKSANQFSQSETPVYLNVYDVAPMNGYMYWAGLGIFHSGVEVHGMEYAFGFLPDKSSGISVMEPKQCFFKFRKSIFIGTTTLDSDQVVQFMTQQGPRYISRSYHTIAKNCNHFCQDICYKLTGKSIPKWVNRMAKIALFCNCILPQGIRVTGRIPDDPNDELHDGEN